MVEASEIIDATEETATGDVDTTVEATGDLNENGGFPTGDLVDGTEAESEESDTNTPARLDFADRAEAMGLSLIGDGCFHHSDSKSEVSYMNLYTHEQAAINAGLQIPQIGIFTKPAGLDGEWRYINIISNMYEFKGNDTIINQIIESIQSVGNAVLAESTVMSPNLCQMRHEITVQNPTNVGNVGDIFPHIVVENSYDGTKAASMSFGLAFQDHDGQDIRFGSKSKFGKIRQVHIENSNTTMEAALGDYVNVFSGEIGGMIQANFDNHITETDMLSTLDLIEKKGGKGRRTMISEYLSEQQGEGIETWAMSSWQLFLAITRFSTLEDNLNGKRILEEVAERVLVVPAQMMSALAAINE